MQSVIYIKNSVISQNGKEKKNHLAFKCMNQHLLTRTSQFCDFSSEGFFSVRKPELSRLEEGILDGRYIAQSLFLNPYRSVPASAPSHGHCLTTGANPPGAGHQLHVSAPNARWPQARRDHHFIHSCCASTPASTRTTWEHLELPVSRPCPESCQIWKQGPIWEGKCVIHLGTFTSKMTFKSMKAS